MRCHGMRRLVAVVAVLIAGVLVVPAEGGRPEALDQTLLQRLSQAAVIRYYFRHPDQAPAGLAARIRELEGMRRPGPGRPGGGVGRSGAIPPPFNLDGSGLPQNETSLAVCPSDPNEALGSTNDFRLLPAIDNFTGWEFSMDGGATAVNDGLTPAIDGLISGGDSVTGVDRHCGFLVADINGDALDFSAGSHGVGVYRSTPARLASCPEGNHASCWPTRRMAVVNEADHLIDKPWMAVGPDGEGGEMAWIVYTDIECSSHPCDPFTSSFTFRILAVRCDVNLDGCTSPVLLSEGQTNDTFAYVVIGPDGRVYLAWAESNWPPSLPEHMRLWMRVAGPGGSRFGPLRLIAQEPKNLNYAYIHGRDFRAATQPKVAVAQVQGKPRVFVTWEGCRYRVFSDAVCEEPQIKLTRSDDLAKSWSRPRAISAADDNYFATIADDSSRGQVVVAYYTTRFDPEFHNRQDVELVVIEAATARVTSRRRVTATSNEPEADPFVGGFFIGDYIQVVAHGGMAYIHYTANYVKESMAGAGPPVPQQDNFMSRVAIG